MNTRMATKNTITIVRLPLMRGVPLRLVPLRLVQYTFTGPTAMQEDQCPCIQAAVKQHPVALPAAAVHGNICCSNNKPTVATLLYSRVSGADVAGRCVAAAQGFLGPASPRPKNETEAARSPLPAPPPLAHSKHCHPTRMP